MSFPNLSRLRRPAPDPLADRYRRLLEHLDNAILFVNPVSGTILDANQQTVQLLGVARDALLQRDLFTLFDRQAHGGNQALDAIRDLRPGERRQFDDVPLVSARGGQQLVDMTAHHLGAEQDHPIVLLIAQESGARHREARRQVEARRVATATRNLTALLDAQAPEPDRVVSLIEDLVLANAVALYRTAHTGSRARQSVAVSQLPEAVATALAQHDTHTPTGPWQWRHGMPAADPLAAAAQEAGWRNVFVQPLGQHPGTAGLMLIGYRHSPPPNHEALIELAAELATGLLAIEHSMALAENNQTHADMLTAVFNTIQDQLLEAVVLIDLGGSVLRVNPAAEQLLGYRAAEVVGRSLADLLVTTDPVVHVLQDSLASGERFERQELTLLRRTGESRQVWLWATALDDPSTGAVIIINDRTEQHQIIQESSDLKQRAYLGKLAQVFAHEVRNPLSNIRLQIERLRRRGHPDDKQSAILDSIESDVERVSKLINDTVDASKPGEVDIRVHDLATLVEHTLVRWAPKLDRFGIVAEVISDPKAPPAMVDARKLDQVFTNLVLNAIDAMRDKGGTLTAKIEPYDGPYGRFVRVHITDTGGGIPDNVLPHIFDAFFTTKSTGTGLGLAHSQHIVSTFKGTLEVDTYPGVGSTFTVTLPSAERAPGGFHP